MPKVLRIINRLNLGGPTFNAAYLTKHLYPEYETMLLSGLKDESEASSEFIVEQLEIEPTYIEGMYRSIHPVLDYQSYKKIRKIIKTYKPDIVHTHAAKAGTLGRLAAIHEKVPVIIHTFHGHVFHSYFNPIKTRLFIEIEKYLANRSTKIIAISEAQKEELSQKFKIAPQDKFEIVQLGFDLSKFQENYFFKREAFRKEFNVDLNVICIAIVGRLVPIKNHFLFLDGIKHLLDNTEKQIKAFIVGDGEDRMLIEQKATQLNIPYNTEKDIVFDKPLIFTSWRKDIDCINAGSDIIVLTSLNEGTPVSLIEAQAANNPIISSRVGGIKDVVIENETALLFDLDKPQDFFKQLLYLVQNDEARSKMGKTGNDYVMKRFHYSRLVSDMKNLYDNLLKK
jgi:glycosyltransferase involved in cell wall biosynthesis